MLQLHEFEITIGEFYRNLVAEEEERVLKELSLKSWILITSSVYL